MNDKIQNLNRHSFKQKEVEFKFHVEIEVINNHILSTATASDLLGATETIYIFLFCLLRGIQKYQRNTFYHCTIILKSINIPTHFVYNFFSSFSSFKKISIEPSDKFIAKLLIYFISHGNNVLRYILCTLIFL